MASELSAVPNPKFKTAPLTTIAGDIVSRRELKIPVNISGTYSHQNNSDGFSSTAIFSLSANEEFLNMERMTIVGDFTPSFYSWVSGYTGPKCQTLPLLDGSLQSIVAKFRIGNAQGLCIDEVINYPTFAATVAKFVDSPAKRKQDLLNFSTQGITHGSGDGWNLQFDSPFYLDANNTLKDGETTRIHLRLLNSSFKNRVPMIPLFLFKNGLEISITFESPYRAFAYQLSSTPFNETRCVAKDCFIARGTYARLNVNGSPVAHGELTPSANLDLNETLDNVGWKYLSLDKLFASTNDLNIVPRARNSILVKESIMLRIKDGLAKAGISSPWPQMPTVARDIGITDFKTYGWVMIPVRVEKNKQCVWSGFASYNDVHDYRMYAHNVALNMYNGDPRVVSHALNTGATAGYENYSAWVNYIEIPAVADQVIGQRNVIAGLVDETNTFEHVFVMQLYGMTAQSAPLFSAGTDFKTCQAYFEANGYEYVFVTDQASYIPYKPRTGGWDGTIADLETVPSDCLKLSYTCPNKSVSPVPFDWVHRALNSNKSALVWNYNVKNLEMKVDMIKPNANVFQDWTTRFQDMSGIPYAFKRTHYNVTTMYGNQQDTVANIQLKLSLRSLCGLVMVLQDAQSSVVNNGTDENYTTLHYPSVSTFMRRGVTRAEVIIGGQSYPIYPLKFLPDGTTGIQWGMDHILSAENFFDASQSSFNGQLTRKDLLPTRNFMGMGNWGLSYEAHTTLAATAHLSRPYGYYYLDATGFVIAFSFMKDDTNGMFTGIDTTQSAIVQVNLYFDRPSTLLTCDINRNFYVESWAICDSVFTLQSDACLIRQ